MKKFKRLTALLLALIMTFAAAAISTSAMQLSDKDELNYSTAPEVFTWIYKNYTDGAVGAFTITQGVLHFPHDVAGYEEPVVDDVPVYVVAIGGTEEVGGMDNDPLSDIKLGGFNLGTPYEEEIVEAIIHDVPKGSNLFLTGHSLGGMTAQQLAADPRIKDNYNVLYVLAFGSPAISPVGREGYMVRLVDKYDWVQYASVNTLVQKAVDPLDLLSTASEETHFSLQELVEYYGNLIKEDNQKEQDSLFGKVSEKKDPPKPGDVDLAIWYVHDASYRSEKTWGQYDVTGKTDMGTTLTLYPKTTKYYKANFENFK